MDEDRLQLLQETGIFSSPGTGSTPSISLGILFSACHFWTSQKICNFIGSSWDNMKERDDDAEMREFLEKLRSQSNQVIPLDEAGEPNWTKVLGNDWNIFKIRQIASGDDNSKSVVQLLRLIRNKHSHPPKQLDDKIALGWFLPNGELDNKAFVTYWSRKFPKLFPFLWLKLYQSIIHSKLIDYYSCLLKPEHVGYMSQLQLDSDIYVELIHDALREHLEKGGLVKRFHNSSLGLEGAITCVVEFRALPFDVIQTALNENSSVIMHVRHDCVSIIWCKVDLTSDELNITYTLEYSLQRPNRNPFRNNTTTLIVVNTLQDKFLIDECTDSSNIIIFFSENVNCIDLADTVVDQISERNLKQSRRVELIPDPLKWMELSDKSKLKLENGKVSFQNKITKIKDILPQGDNEYMFSLLQGNDLINALLVGDQPKVFGKHEFPSTSNEYIKRKLFRTCMLTSKVLRHRKNDIFIVSGISLEVLRGKVNLGEKIKEIEQIEVLMSGKEDLAVRIYCTKGFELRNIFKILGSNSKKPKHGIHFLRYVEDDFFEWLGTFGSHEVIKSFLLADKVQADEEQRFLEKIIENPIEPIFIADKPGMGKSLLLSSLSCKISKTFHKSFVLHLQAKDFVEKISKMNGGKCGKEQIELFIVNTLCTTTFEKCVVKFWLQQKEVTSTSMKFELMLDGLDEVKKHKNLALNILKCIHREFSSIRLWVTLREHMIEELENCFSVIVYKILPLSENEQIDFLTKHWISKQDAYSPQQLAKLAKNCLAGLMSRGIKTELAGAPLHCRMLAEIYEDKLDELADEKNIHYTLTNMYESMVNKKLREFLKEKKGMPDDDDDYFMLPIKENMQLRHMYLAIKLLFSDQTAELFCAQLKITPQNKSIMESTVKDEGIILNMKPLTFIHRTFAEYFGALFIFKVLTGEISGLDTSNVDFQNFLIKEALDVSNSTQQLSYDTEKSEGKFIAKFKFPVLCYFLNAMLDDAEVEITPNEIENIITKTQDFEEGVFESNKSIILATLQGSHFNMAKLIFESLSELNRDRFMRRSRFMPDFLLEASVRCTDVDFFKYTCTFIENWYSAHHHDGQYEIPVSIFKIALNKGKYEIAKLLIDEKGFHKGKWANLRESDKKDHGIYHWIIMKTKSKHDEEREEVLAEKKKLLKYVHSIDSSVLEQKDKKGETPLFMPPSVTFALKKYLITDLGANVNAVGKFRNTPFHWKSYPLYRSLLSPEGYHEMLETFIQHGFRQINLFNRDGCTPLHCAIKTFEHSLQRKTLDLFCKVNADFNAKDDKGKGSTVLQFCIKRKCPTEFILQLIDCGSDIYIKNPDGLNALKLAREINYKELEEILVEDFGAHIENGEE